MRMQTVAGTQCRDAMWKAAHMSTAICFTATGQTRTKSCPHLLFHNALGRTENALFALAARAGVSYCDHCCRPAHSHIILRHSGRTSFFGFRFLCTQKTRGGRKEKMRGGSLHPYRCTESAWVRRVREGAERHHPLTFFGELCERVKLLICLQWRARV